MLSEPAYAKINLALHVRRRREDGFHELESLFAFAEDGDLIEAEDDPDGRLSLLIEGPFGHGLDSGADNLVLRAAQALRVATGTARGARLRLDKRLPIASGIGGGSADAAATLRLLDRLWGLELSQDALLAIADPLGSDVPACLVSETLVGTGRGEALALADLPGLAGMPLLLVNPGVAVSTGPVFRAWDGTGRGALRADSLDAIVREGRNDLEAPAMSIAPQIAQVLESLTGRPGVALARMSGSGATCFALFDSEAARDSVAEAISNAQPGWWVMKSRIRG